MHLSDTANSFCKKPFDKSNCAACHCHNHNHGHNNCINYAWVCFESEIQVGPAPILPQPLLCYTSHLFLMLYDDVRTTDAMLRVPCLHPPSQYLDYT